MEKWVDINDYNSLYQVSDMGRIKSLSRIRQDIHGNCKLNEKILKNGTNPCGYIVCCLFKNKNRAYFTVHKLVIEHFLNEKTTRMRQVNHIDKNKKNNSLANLEVVSPKENINHSIENRIGCNNGNSKLNEVDIINIRSLAGKDSYVKIAKKFNCTRGAIEAVIKRKTWRHIK